MVVPFLIVSVSGSKSQFGSGVPAAAFANSAENVVDAPSAMFLQKSGPTAVGALKVAGSHSSKETTCAVPGESSSSIQPANNEQQTTKPNFNRVFVMDLLPFVLTMHPRNGRQLGQCHFWSQVRFWRPLSPVVAKASILATPIYPQSFLHSKTIKNKDVFGTRR